MISSVITSIFYKKPSIYRDNKKRLILWLYIVAFMVLCMVFIGGFTRLTNSGLSITEWKPVTGVIPPLNESEWFLEFERYRDSPEFRLLKESINMDEFQFIYLVEYFHRLLARITGLVFLIPLIFFWLKNYLTTRLKRMSIIILGIGIIQGFMGWYMVKSGLYDKPYVSHFRLSFHLIFAAVIFSLIIWEIENLKFSSPKNLYLNDKYAIFSVLVCYIQIWLGGLVAGLDGGLVYNEFPMMGDSFIPSEIYTKENFLISLSDSSSVQFFHRIVAYFFTIIVLINCYRIFQRKNILLSIYLAVTIFLQLILGIITLIYKVPLSTALLHQFTAFIILALLIKSIRHKS